MSKKVVIIGLGYIAGKTILEQIPDAEIITIDDATQQTIPKAIEKEVVKKIHIPQREVYFKPPKIHPKHQKHNKYHK